MQIKDFQEMWKEEAYKEWSQEMKEYEENCDTFLVCCVIVLNKFCNLC